MYFQIHPKRKSDLTVPRNRELTVKGSVFTRNGSLTGGMSKNNRIPVFLQPSEKRLVYTGKIRFPYTSLMTCPKPM
jgi:hypothetical protein